MGKHRPQQGAPCPQRTQDTRPCPCPQGIPGCPSLTQAVSSFTTTSANSWLLSILCFVRTNISIIFWETLRALVLELGRDRVRGLVKGKPPSWGTLQEPHNEAPAQAIQKGAWQGPAENLTQLTCPLQL